MIAIIDLGIGNCGSIAFALKKLTFPCTITTDLSVIKQVKKIILPGVGAFDTVITAIDQLGLRSVLLEIAADKEKSLLGICVGMQVLANSSEEGKLSGLGLIAGRCVKFKQTNLKVPHMGWNELVVKTNCPLFTDMAHDSRFYFVHSYYVEPDNVDAVAATSHYGTAFTSAIHANNIYGVQFHPEKSHRFGLTILKNFVET